MTDPHSASAADASSHPTPALPPADPAWPRMPLGQYVHIQHISAQWRGRWVSERPLCGGQQATLPGDGPERDHDNTPVLPFEPRDGMLLLVEACGPFLLTSRVRRRGRTVQLGLGRHEGAEDPLIKPVSWVIKRALSHDVDPDWLAGVCAGMILRGAQQIQRHVQGGFFGAPPVWRDLARTLTFKEISVPPLAVQRQYAAQITGLQDSTSALNRLELQKIWKQQLICVAVADRVSQPVSPGWSAAPPAPGAPEALQHTPETGHGA